MEGKKCRKEKKPKKGEIRIIQNQIYFENPKCLPVSRAYSQVATVQNIIYVSAQSSFDMNGCISENTYERVRQAFLNLKCAVESACSELKYAISLEIYIANACNQKDFERVKEIITKVQDQEELWGCHPKPTRSVIAGVLWLPKAEDVCGAFINVSGVFLRPSLGVDVELKECTITSTCSSSSSSSDCTSSSSSC